MNKHLFTSAVLFLAVCWCAASLFAQSTTGRIVGTVTDETGAVLPGVDVVVRNPANGLTRSVITEESGNFNVPLLPPGSYEVQASLSGFRREVRTGITVQVESVLRVNFTLRVGEITNELKVVADAPLIQSENASIGQIMDSRAVTDLPLNQRTFMALTTLTTGIQPSVEGSNLSNQSLSFNSVGAREDHNNFLLDGVDNNDTGNSQLVIIPSIDAIQEFKVQTSTYGAEFGRAGGAVVNIQTKAGTNAFHGTAFEFVRNDIFDARNFFAAKKPPYRRNQYGVVFSGPIKKDKTFFMVNYEGTRVRQGQTALGNVPSANQRAGDFSDLGKPLIDPLTGQAFPGNRIPANRFDSVGKGILGFYPLPNRTNAQNNYLTGAKLTENFYIFTTRVDHRISDKHSIFGRFTYQDSYRVSPEFQTGTTLPNFGAVFFQPIGRNVALSDTYVFGPNVVNEARVGFNRLKGGIYEQLYKNDYAKQLGIKGVQSQLYPNSEGLNLGFPRVNVTGVSNMSGSYSPQLRYDNTWHWFDMLAVTRGKHQMKMGGEVRTMYMNIFLDLYPNGSFLFTGQYTGSGTADLILGYPAQTIRFVGDSHVHVRERAVSTFFQDDWKVSRKTTLNLGLRWEYQTPVVAGEDLTMFDTGTKQIVIAGKSGSQTFADPVSRAPITLQGGAGLGYPRAGYASDFKNFAPRIGFAWTPTDKGNMVVRGGYGVFYTPVIPAQNWYRKSLSYPYVLPQFFSGDPSKPNLSLQDPFPSALGFTAISTYAIDRKMRTGYMQNWNLGIQRQLGNDMVLDVSYVGSKGTRLQYSYWGPDINQAVLGPGSVDSRRSFPGFSSINHAENTASSNFHSLQGKFERRLSGGFTFVSAYTLSHSIDNDSGSNGLGGGSTQNSRNLRAERGNSVFDIRHRWVNSYSYELPFGTGKHFLKSLSRGPAMIVGGWQIAGITTFSTGQSFTPEVPGDISNTGISFVRPNRIGKGTLPSDQRSPERWFDTKAFVVPAAGTFGNSGRGILKAPGMNNWDLTLMKNVQIHEAQNLQLRFEFFNAINHPGFLLPDNQVTSPGFGSILRARDGREIQFGAKYNF